MAVQKQKGGLGKGLGALLSTDTASVIQHDMVKELPINKVHPCLKNPRKLFDKEKLEELAESIKQAGIIVPIIVTKQEKEYMIIAGERRWRAAKLANLKTIPSIIREISDDQILQQALIENVQRQDLNPMEEAETLNKLAKDYKMKQVDIGQLIGKSRSYVANFLRLMNLPELIKEMLLSEDITYGHARALLAIDDEEKQIEFANYIVSKQYNVRQTEQFIQSYLNPSKKKKKAEKTKEYQMAIEDCKERLTKVLGTKVKIKDFGKKGSVVIEYYSVDDLERILDVIEK